MTPIDLRAWQTKMRYTQDQAAVALGMSTSGYKDLVLGVRRASGKPIEKIDRRTALACAALAVGLVEWGSNGIACNLGVVIPLGDKK